MDARTAIRAADHRGTLLLWTEKAPREYVKYLLQMKDLLFKTLQDIRAFINPEQRKIQVSLTTTKSRAKITISDHGL